MEAKNEPLIRCPWCGNDPLYVKYHDDEWGKIITDDVKLFELLILEGAQAGLSWYTILMKRENYRKAFHNFDFRKIAEMTSKNEQKLLKNDGIVRNRLKIHSTIVNARLFRDIITEFGSFYDYVVSFFPNRRPIVNDIEDIRDIPNTSSISDAISKNLKSRGFKFVGSKIIYSFLQAAGFIDDHLNSCHCKTPFNNKC